MATTATGAGAGAGAGATAITTTTTTTSATSDGSTGRFFACRKCRRRLFDDSDLLEHDASSQQFSYRRRAKEARAAHIASSATSAASTSCDSWFLKGPPDWMSADASGGKIKCTCGTRLGIFKWAGHQCSCGSWITPAFQFPKSKLDVRGDAVAIKVVDAAAGMQRATQAALQNAESGAAAVSGGVTTDSATPAASATIEATATDADTGAGADIATATTTPSSAPTPTV